MLNRCGRLLILCVGLLLMARAEAASNILRCVDGRIGGVTQTGRPPLNLDVLMCDADGTRDGSCQFASYCPICLMQSPACLAPCFTMPRYTWAIVPVGRAVSVRTDSAILLFRCDRMPRRRPLLLR